MYNHPETNPHFNPLQPPPQHEDQRSQPPGQRVSQPQRQGQQIQPSEPRRQDQQTQPYGSQVQQPQRQGQQPSGRPRQKQQRGKQSTTFETPWLPSQHQGQQSSGPSQHPGQELSPWYPQPARPSYPLSPQGQHSQPHSTPVPEAQHHGQPLRPLSPISPQGQHSQPHSPPVPEAQHHGQPPKRPKPLLRPQGPLSPPHYPPVPEAQHHGQPPKRPKPLLRPQGPLSPPHYPPVPEAQSQGRSPHPHSPQYEGHSSQTLIRPRPRTTKWIHWFIAAFCTIFWVVIILGGLAVLIVYLVFRPRSPRFDVPTATLNAAYLDTGYLLNADLTLLANFTNPNKKVSVDFSYVTLDLYHANTLIATQYIEPFKAARKESRFASVEMVTSQVLLPYQESEQLKKEIDSNKVLFEIKGVFHARSILGNFLGYSYRLYAHCYIEVASPPSGVLLASKCKTKR